jgi:hypothetical protein
MGTLILCIYKRSIVTFACPNSRLKFISLKKVHFSYLLAMPMQKWLKVAKCEILISWILVFSTS